jgi:hypothetical protein
MSHRGKENFGGVLKFIVNDLHWELNYRGDAPLLIYQTNGTNHIVQIDGDLFFAIDVDLCDGEETEDIAEEEFDSYLFTMEEALKFINIMLYEDMELEYDPSIAKEDLTGDDYELFYDGENEEAFNKLEAKVAKYERILEEDIEALTKYSQIA